MGFRNFLVFFIVLSFLSVGFVSCGDNKTQYDVEQKVSGVTWPTPQSYSRWKDIWDDGSWIVALSREHQQLKSSSLLRNFVASRFARDLQSQDQSLQIESLVPEISTLLDLRVLTVANFEKPIPSGASPLPVFGFAEIRMKNGLRGLQNIFLLSQYWSTTLNSIKDPLEKERFLVGWIWNSLESMAGIEFAEPNLFSQVQQSGNKIDAVEITARMKRQWNTYLLGVDRLFETAKDANTVVVAVIDTGVDNKLDDAGNALAARLYRNPGEDPGSKGQPFVDDDGNGWVDDYIGVDATIPKGGIDNGPAPRPGSNDIGGAGAECSSGVGSGVNSCGHGTHVAGIIAGGALVDSPYVGVCPRNCSILPIRAATRCYVSRQSQNPDKDKVCPTPGSVWLTDPNSQIEVDGGISDASQLNALAYILDLTSPTNPDLLLTNIVNLSLGRYFSSRSLSLMARRLIANDVLIIAAAGNLNVEIPMFPAAYKDVVAVCATSHDPGDTTQDSEPTGSSDKQKGSGPVRGRRLKSRFSNFGDWVDICAPGSNIKSSVPGGKPEFKSGTSQAAPHVAGVAALIKSIATHLNAADVRSYLLRYANFDLLYGALPSGGLANADFTFSPYGNIKVFMLGSGMVSAENIFYAFTDPAKARELVSQAEQAMRDGNVNQVTSGCVVSSLAVNHPAKRIEVWTSLPVMLFSMWFILFLVRRAKKRARSTRV